MDRDPSRWGTGAGPTGWFTYRLLWWLSLVMTMLLTEPVARAQVGAPIPPIFDPTGRSGEPPAPLRKEFERPTPPPRQILPPVPLPPEESVEKPLGDIRVFVKDIRVIGSSVFSTEELADVTESFRNRTLATEDLERLRLSLTLLYINKGYLTSGAVIPDQDMKDGVLTMQIIEGTLSRIDVEGNKWFASSYLRNRVARGIRTPVTLPPLQERLQLLQQDQRIERINAELRPGDQQGESVLNLRVTDRNPFHGYIEVNNYQTPLVGEIRGLATVIDDNLTGHGDPVRFTYGQSQGAIPIIDAAYALPLNRYDTTFSPYYRRNDYKLVESPFDALSLKTNTEIIGMSLRQPVYRTANDEVALLVVGEHLFIQSFVFGNIPFSLFPGFQNGVATVSALRFIQEWTHRTSDVVVAVRSRFSVGLNVLGATINSDSSTPDGQFFSWLGQGQAIKQFGDNLFGMQLLGRMDLQVTNSPLFPQEQVALGGRYSVRGYREVTLLRDNVYLASVESRFPLLRWTSGEPMVQFAQFVDVGHGWNMGQNRAFATQPNATLPDTLASVGVGLRWNILPKDRANFEVYWGQRLNHVPKISNTIQDHGVHFGVVVNLF